jgi:hypothetical protein
MEDLVVVEDGAEQYPSFVNMLYCSLDPSLVLLYIMCFFFFDIALNQNALLAAFCTYAVERILRYIRASLGENNLCEKGYIEENFLI